MNENKFCSALLPSFLFHKKKKPKQVKYEIISPFFSDQTLCKMNHISETTISPIKIIQRLIRVDNFSYINSQSYLIMII